MKKTDPAKGPPPTIVLTVRYEGTGKSVIPTGPRMGATCPLVDYADGRTNRPPDKNVARLRLWLEEHGYHPSFEEWKWLDRGHGPRRRREVYRLKAPPTRDLYDETIDTNFLRQMYEEMKPPRLPEAEHLALYKRKALAGAPRFETCQDCEHVQDCPHGWGACNRKAEAAKIRQAELDRPRSNRNPAFSAYRY